MTQLAFTDQQERLRRILQNALAGATYESSRQEEDGRTLVIEAKRPDGRQVVVRFRGVRESEASEAPSPGSSLRLGSIGSAERFWLARMLFPTTFPHGIGRGAARVRIEAGPARLDIVCEDAEWWENDSQG